MDFRDSSSMVNGTTHVHALPHAQNHAPLLPQEIIDDESQLSMSGPWAIHVDSTHTLPSTMLGTQSLAFNNVVSNSTPQTRTLNDLLTPLLQHHDTCGFREVLTTYLRLPINLWQALRQLRESAFVHEIFPDKLPRELWHLMVNLRDDIHFDRLQPLIVSTFQEHISFMAATTSQNHSRSGSSTSWYEGGKSQMVNGVSRPALHPSHATSPSLSGFQFSSPAQPEHPMQTRSVTPVSIMFPSRNPSQSPWRNKKGKAPAGQLYVCPLPNCTKKGFKNVGNYINHMLRLHNGYPRHDPETSLQPESSLSLENSDDFVSPAATTAENSPILVRHLSQDWSSLGDVHSNFGADETNALATINSRVSDTNVENFDVASPLVSDQGANNRDQDFVEMNHHPETAQEEMDPPADGDQEYSSVDTGGLSFGMFQATIMSARRSNHHKMSF